MNADAEFLKLVREYLHAENNGYCAIDTVTNMPRDCHIAMSVELRNARERLVAAVQEIIQRQSQPQLWEGEK